MKYNSSANGKNGQYEVRKDGVNPKRTKVIASGIPAEMKSLKRWVVWKDSNGQEKVPHDVYGNKAETTNPETWDTFQRCMMHYEDRHGINGVGFVFAGEFIGIDLDGAKTNNGSPLESEWELVRKFNSFAERTPSGGIHIIIEAKVPDGTWVHKRDNLEWYHKERYFTVTGNHIEGFPQSPQPRQAELEWFLSTYMKKTPTVVRDVDTGALVSVSDGEKVRQCREYLWHCAGAKQGQGEGGADGYAFAIAINVVWGFDFINDLETAESLMMEWGEREDNTYEDGSYYPWTLAQIRHKIVDASFVDYHGVAGDRLRAVIDVPDGAVMPLEAQVAELGLIPELQADVDHAAPNTEAGSSILDDPFPLLFISDLDKLPKANPQIADHWDKGRLVMVYGPSNSGKTFFGLDAALSVAHGVPLYGTFPVEQGNVLYICSEDADDLKRRIPAWLIEHDVEPNHRFCFFPCAFNFHEPKHIDFIVKKARAGFEAHGVGSEIALVIVDPMAENFGNLNPRDGRDMQSYVAGCRQLNKATGATTLTFQHTGWDTSRERDASQLRGAMSTVIKIEPIMVGNQQTGARVIVEKQRTGEKLKPYRIEPHKIDTPHGQSIVFTRTLDTNMRRDELATELAHTLKEIEVHLYADSFGPTKAHEIIGEAIGKGKSTVARHLKDLTNAGFLVDAGNGKYRLNVDDLGTYQKGGNS